MSGDEIEALTSQIIFDNTMDIRRVLRARGIDPGTLDEAPACDVCWSWKATHVQTAPSGTLYIVCDKPRCQDWVSASKE